MVLRSLSINSALLRIVQVLPYHRKYDSSKGARVQIVPVIGDSLENCPTLAANPPRSFLTSRIIATIPIGFMCERACNCCLTRRTATTKARCWGTLADKLSDGRQSVRPERTENGFRIVCRSASSESIPWITFPKTHGDDLLEQDSCLLACLSN